MRLPVDARRTARSCGSTGRSRRGRGCAARTSSARGASRTCSRPAAGSTTRRTTRRCCRCRARCARSRSRSCAPTARASPALVNSVLRDDEQGRPRVIRTTVFDATDRRRYERRAAARAPRASTRPPSSSSAACCRASCPRRRGCEIEVAYRPAVRGLEVGGDWYDAFWLDAGDTVGLVVGDVVGRGIDAAATMGQLRSAVRALASTGLPPGRLLDALDALRRRHAVGQMTTLVYAQLDLGSRRLRYACAGHPPPLILEPGGGAALRVGRALDAARRPLRVRRAARGGGGHARPGQHRCCSTPTAWSSAATESLTEGMDRLLGVAATRRDDTAAALVGAVVRRAPRPRARRRRLRARGPRARDLSGRARGTGCRRAGSRGS